MTTSELIAILGGIGWVVDYDEVGDVFCFFDLGDRQVQIIPSIAKRSDHYRIGFMPSVSTKKFSNAGGVILGKEGMHHPIASMQEIPKKIANPAAGDVIGMSDEVLSWAKNQNIEMALEIYRGISTDAKGAMPVRHLAALAIGGGIEKLLSYRDSFERGNRLGFPPYITKEIIDRAVLIAEGK